MQITTAFKKCDIKFQIKSLAKPAEQTNGPKARCQRPHTDEDFPSRGNARKDLHNGAQ